MFLPLEHEISELKPQPILGIYILSYSPIVSYMPPSNVWHNICYCIVVL